MYFSCQGKYYKMYICLGKSLSICQLPRQISNAALFLEGPPTPLWVPPSFWSKFKKFPPFSECHPDWCMQIVRNTIKWRCYVLYYTKSIENIINITVFTFRLNSVFYYLHFLWLDIAFNDFHTWCARGMNMKHF